MTRTLRLTPALSRWRLAAWLPPLLLALIWLAAELIVQPYGNMPLGDDWSYARVACTLAAEGRYDFTLPTSTTLLAHVAWGALWVKLFGCSFEVLRLSVAVLGLGGLLALYQLAREAGLRPDRAFVAAVMVGLNPFYLKLSNSFMTDVSFAAFAIGAIWVAVRAIRLERSSLFVLGVVLMIVAVLVRQLGLVLPIAIAVGLAVRGEWWGRWAWRLWVPTSLCLGVYLIYVAWLQLQPVPPPGSGALSLMSWVGSLVAQPGLVAYNLVVYGGRAWIYWGLLMLPLLLLRAPKRPDREPQLTRLVDIVCGALFGAWVVAAALKGNLLTVGDHLVDFGLGPLTVVGAYPSGSAAYGQLPPGAWTLISILGALGGALLLRTLLYHCIAIARHRRLMGSARAYWIDLTLLTLLILYSLPLVTAGYFDRYLLFGWVPLLILLLRTTDPLTWTRRSVRTSLTALAYLPFIWFSICGTHDYLAWTRARKQLLSELLAGGIPRDQIEAGYEHDNYDAAQPIHYAGAMQSREAFAQRRPIVLAFEAPVNLPNEKVSLISELAWQQWLWLPPRMNYIRVYERAEPVSEPETK